MRLQGFTSADGTEIVDHFREFGFAIIRNVLDQDLMAEADAHVRWLINKYPNLRPEHLHHPLIRNDAFWVRLVSDSRLLDIAELILGPNIACFTAHYICKPPKDGQAVLWHQDGAYWGLQPMEAVAAWLAVDRTNPENGCLRMIPGSHVAEITPPQLQTDPPNMLYSQIQSELVESWVKRAGVVDVVLEPGDLSIHHPRILHCSGPNNSDVRRCGLDIGYVATSTRITNTNLYLNPLLLRGRAVPDVNRYRMWPEYAPGDTIAFRDERTYSELAAVRNASLLAYDSTSAADSPIAAAERMIARLREGSVKT